jgi:hypothetical protein
MVSLERPLKNSRDASTRDATSLAKPVLATCLLRSRIVEKSGKNKP